MNGRANIPLPVNEPLLSYAPGTPERSELKAELERLADRVEDIPLLIGGEEIRTGETFEVVMPHDHGHVIARAQVARAEDARRAVESALEAREAWAAMPWRDRAAIFLKAADLLAGPWRQTVNAATMLGQSKTAHQAEIDGAAELVDFLRFNVHYADGIYAQQPRSEPGVWNRTEYRGLEGFIYAISPFNFTAIGGNLSSAPAMMGNVSIWKPARTSALANYYVARIFEEAGLPPGVINFITGRSSAISEVVLHDPNLAGIHFTGSTEVFQLLWKTVGENIASYASYPRLVGETGGKDFIVAHGSADPDALVTAIVRGAFEYQGQKCSAASRAYIPESLWERVRDPLITQTAELRMGDPRDFRNFVSAVIDQASFGKIAAYIERAREADEAEILVGGRCDDAKGWFVEPTIILSHTPDYEAMCDEIFGPVMTLYVYPDGEWSETLELVDSTSPYALTGAVFARDRVALREASSRLRHAAGNFYINDKPTGAVVGQQPFGGARASGTNDKAGSALNLLRWVSAQSIKETFVPPTDYRYPFMDEA